MYVFCAIFLKKIENECIKNGFVVEYVYIV